MKAPPGDAASVEYEMGYRADEFGKVLSGSFSGENSDYSCETLERHYWRISHRDAEFQVVIRVIEMPERKLGLFSLPVLQACFEMKKSSPELQDNFFIRFFKYFHKGGG
ncbi:MAG: hypothetical protein GY784_18195 [Gammaproteobacteria bacterium]|nr:hypothetical protein [Gammaproteobacteria bacterium]